MDDSEYDRLAEQADRLAKVAPDGRFATSWQRIARGFRELARLRVGFARAAANRRQQSDERTDH